MKHTYILICSCFLTHNSKILAKCLDGYLQLSCEFEKLWFCSFFLFLIEQKTFFCEHVWLQWFFYYFFYYYRTTIWGRACRIRKYNCLKIENSQKKRTGYTCYTALLDYFYFLLLSSFFRAILFVILENYSSNSKYWIQVTCLKAKRCVTPKSKTGYVLNKTWSRSAILWSFWFLSNDIFACRSTKFAFFLLKL